MGYSQNQISVCLYYFYIVYIKAKEDKYLGKVSNFIGSIIHKITAVAKNILKLIFKFTIFVEKNRLI